MFFRNFSHLFRLASLNLFNLPRVITKVMDIDRSNKVSHLRHRIKGINSKIIDLKSDMRALQSDLNELFGVDLLNEMSMMEDKLNKYNQLINKYEGINTLETDGKRKMTTTEKSTKKSRLEDKLDDFKDDFDGASSNINFVKEGDYVVVYTDGACTNNGRSDAKAGIGVWWENNHCLNVSEPAKIRQTNNAAEIQACARACKLAGSNGIKKLLIRTDSQFVINCMTKWLPNWLKNNWMTAAGKPVINKDDLLELMKYAKRLDQVKYEHIRAHCGIRGNEAADKLAVQGAERA